MGIIHVIEVFGAERAASPGLIDVRSRCQAKTAEVGRMRYPCRPPTSPSPLSLLFSPSLLTRLLITRLSAVRTPCRSHSRKGVFFLEGTARPFPPTVICEPLILN